MKPVRKVVMDESLSVMLLLMVPGKVMKSVGEIVIDKLLSYVLLVMVHGQVRDYYFCSLLAFFVSLV
jgi:hypothetical protein